MAAAVRRGCRTPLKLPVRRWFPVRTLGGRRPAERLGGVRRRSGYLPRFPPSKGHKVTNGSESGIEPDFERSQERFVTDTKSAANRHGKRGVTYVTFSEPEGRGVWARIGPRVTHVSARFRLWSGSGRRASNPRPLAWEAGGLWLWGAGLGRRCDLDATLTASLPAAQQVRLQERQSTWALAALTDTGASRGCRLKSLPQRARGPRVRRRARKRLPELCVRPGESFGDFRG
jgi:hypothetical protein